MYAQKSANLAADIPYVVISDDIFIKSCIFKLLYIIIYLSICPRNWNPSRNPVELIWKLKLCCYSKLMAAIRDVEFAYFTQKPNTFGNIALYLKTKRNQSIKILFLKRFVTKIWICSFIRALINKIWELKPAQIQMKCIFHPAISFYNWLLSQNERIWFKGNVLNDLK